MRAALLLFTAPLMLSSALQATVSIGFSADRLKDANGAPLPVNSPIYLIVDTAGDGYDGPVTGSYVQDDDRLITTYNTIEPGTGQGFSGGIVTPEGVSAGQTLYVVWTSAAHPPQSGDTYGVFTAPQGYNPPMGSQPWVYPSEGSSVDVFFITADSSYADTINGTVISADAGLASRTFGEVPPPTPFGAVLQTDDMWTEYAQMGWIDASTAPWYQGIYFGYFYYFGSGEGPFWAWTYTLGWFWADPQIWPTLYTFDYGWLRYQQGTPAPDRWFYSYADGQWLRESEF